MAETTAIAWTDHTFNPVRGCAKISPGCEHCYAAAMAKRNPAVLGEWGSDGTRVVASDAMWEQPLKWARRWRKRKAVDPDLRRKRVFCASMADWLEDRLEWLEPRRRLIDTIYDTYDALEWQLLTKRPENGARFLAPPTIKRLADAGVRIGVSVENQDYAHRITQLLEWWRGPNFVSVEPMLGPVDLERIAFPHSNGNLLFVGDEGGAEYAGAPRQMLGCVICGGESGHGFRPMQIQWARDLHDQCKRAGVPFFMKQDSGQYPGRQGRLPEDLWACKEFPG